MQKKSAAGLHSLNRKFTALTTKKTNLRTCRHHTDEDTFL